jgi:CRISPR system Cascade subunit CasA
MPQARTFNLVDEAWVPIAGKAPASLREVFARDDLGALGGSPIQKIALLKLFLAIAQAARTPRDDADWSAMKPNGLGDACLAYLEKWHDAFWLYGERPFLQMPGVAGAEKKSFGTLLPHIATGNTTVLLDLHREMQMGDADKALLLMVLMGFGLGGKKTDNSIVLTPGYAAKSNEKGNAATGKPGTSLGFFGYQHHFLMGATLRESVWFNMLTADDLPSLLVFPEGVGAPPWERVPEGEDCGVAQALKKSLMGRLVPLSKFVLLAEDGVHYSDGILHADIKSGGFDPSVAIDASGKEAKATWVDPEKQLWRHLPALLAFLAGKQRASCLGVRRGVGRVRGQCRHFGLWAGGIRVSSNAGEQYASGGDDYAESTLWLASEDMGEPWLDAFACEMDGLDYLATKLLYGRVMGYHKSLKADGKKQAIAATAIFWQQCGSRAQALVDACGNGTQRELRPVFADFARETYNDACPRDTARQLEAWAANRPNAAKYLKPQ